MYSIKQPDESIFDHHKRLIGLGEIRKGYTPLKPKDSWQLMDNYEHGF